MSGTSNINNFLKGYFSIEGTREVVIDNRTTPASFPNTMTTISEVDQVQMDEVLRRVLSNTLFAWVGFIAFFGLAVLRWRVLLTIGADVSFGIAQFSVVKSLYYVFSTVYWYWVGVVVSSRY